MKRLILIIAAALAIASPICSAQESGSSNIKIDYLVKGSLGWAYHGAFIPGAIAPQVGAMADIAVLNPLTIQTGIELKLTGFGNKTDFSGLSGSSSDFYEVYHYRFNYIAIPVHIKYNDPDDPESFLNGLYAGLGLNIPFAGSYNWKRYKTGLKSKSVDSSGSGKVTLDKLTSPAISICLGFDQKINEHWGFTVQIESLLNTRASTEGYNINSYRIGAIYYL